MRRGSNATLFAVLSTGVLACGPSPERGPAERDCSVQTAYERKYIVQWNRLGVPPGLRICNETIIGEMPIGEAENQAFFCAPDSTPPVGTGSDLGANHSLEVIDPDEQCPLPNGDPSETAHVFRFDRNRDWGAVIGTYRSLNVTDTAAVDVPVETTMPTDNHTPYEGLSFWARQEGDPGFALLLNDKNTQPHASFMTDMGLPSCTSILTPEQLNEGGIPEKGTCGNSFEVTVLPTRHWQFYRIPFSQFNQQLWPNRIPTGVHAPSTHTVLIRGPKDSTSELWLDQIAWYRRATN